MENKNEYSALTISSNSTEETRNMTSFSRRQTKLGSLSGPDFIGRGEVLTKQLLENPFGVSEIKKQVHISRLIPKYEYDLLDEEWQKHKFDMVLFRNDLSKIVIEINYKHGNKAAFKAEKFKNMLLRYDTQYVTIDDYDCRSSIKKDNGQFELGLFHENSKGNHTLSWNDLRDIIDAFEKAGINP